jgi:hypothetical protein
LQNKIQQLTFAVYYFTNTPINNKKLYYYD